MAKQENMELLILLFRACGQNRDIEKKVILACTGIGSVDSEVITILEKLKALVEEMEGNTVSTEELCERIKASDPATKAFDMDTFSARK